MAAKERMMTAIHRKKPDRLPVTIHQWQPFHLRQYMNGMTDIEANASCGLDASITYAEMRERESADWKVAVTRQKETDHEQICTVIQTPEGTLTTQSGANAMTVWVTEHLIKQPEDIYLLKKYRPVPLLNRDGLQKTYDRLGDGGILRTFICGAQGGCWQDACELHGTEQMILATFDNPDWVHEFLEILLEKKLQYIEESMPHLPIDLVETGGGAASNTVISPSLHEEFCLPYDKRMHDAIHRLGYPVVYHTCGGMTKLTHLIAANGCDASETLSPISVGGDIGSDQAARQVYEDLHPYVGLIGGMDQFGLLEQGSKEQIAAEVARLFELFGRDGGFILSASDHFFHAPPENLAAFAEAAREFTYA